MSLFLTAIANDLRNVLVLACLFLCKSSVGSRSKSIISLVFTVLLGLVGLSFLAFLGYFGGFSSLFGLVVLTLILAWTLEGCAAF